MKNCFLLLMITFLLACNASKQPKVEYNMPNDINKIQRKNLLAELNFGKRLYKIHCSACHGIIGNGKDSVPDFSKKQFDAYTANILAKSNLVHRPARKLQAEDLASIFKFLQYYKRQYH